MRSIRVFAAAFTLLLLLASTGHAQSSTLRGKVVKIVDGDTFTLLDGGNVEHNVRIVGIDAPEEGQASHAEAKQKLTDLLLNKEVTVEIVKKDKPDREVAILKLGEQDIGLLMVEAGLAWHNEFFDLEQAPEVKTAYRFAEIRARGSKRGVWTQNDPVSPWAYRRINRLDPLAEETQTTATRVSSPAPQTNSGGTVHVKGYYRKDGTYVRPHTRSAPRKKN